MSSSKPVAFIIGAGANVGASVASFLEKKGYAVAVGSRSAAQATPAKDAFKHVKVDVTSAESVKDAFANVTKDLGAPSVVVYNPATHAPPAKPGSPLTVPLQSFQDAISIGANTFTAAQAFYEGLSSSPSTAGPGTFIATGNILPRLSPTAPYTALDALKNIQDRTIRLLASSYATLEEGPRARFYYAYLVGNDGGIPPYTDFLKSGEAHGKVYWELVSAAKQGPYEYRFTLDAKEYKSSQ